MKKSFLLFVLLITSATCGLVFASSDPSDWSVIELSDGFQVLTPPDWQQGELSDSPTANVSFSIPGDNQSIFTIMIKDNLTFDPESESDLTSILFDSSETSYYQRYNGPAYLDTNMIWIGEKPNGMTDLIYVTPTPNKIILAVESNSSVEIENFEEHTPFQVFTTIYKPDLITFSDSVEIKSTTNPAPTATLTPTPTATPSPTPTYVQPTVTPTPVRTYAQPTVTPKTIPQATYVKPTSVPTPIRTYVQPTAVPSLPSSGPVCDCSGNNYNCKDFPLSNGISDQKCYEYCKSQGMGDIHDLDRNNDGDACEAGWS